MAKFIIMYAFEFIIALTLFSQVILPMFSKRLKYFWIFRTADKSETTITTLSELSDRAEKVKFQKDELDENIENAEQILEEIKSKSH